MLSPEQNEPITRTGPGTAAGKADALLLAAGCARRRACWQSVGRAGATDRYPHTRFGKCLRHTAPNAAARGCNKSGITGEIEIHSMPPVSG